MLIRKRFSLKKDVLWCFLVVCTKLDVKTRAAKFYSDFHILTLYLEYFEIRSESSLIPYQIRISLFPPQYFCIEFSPSAHYRQPITDIEAPPQYFQAF
jgi:hypothetical protein